MHSIHKSVFDGAGINPAIHFINPGAKGQYIFEAMPVGTYVAHCHVSPTALHIGNGLYLTMIIDPKEFSEPANEIILMASAYDIDKDGVKIGKFNDYRKKGCDSPSCCPRE